MQDVYLVDGRLVLKYVLLVADFLQRKHMHVTLMHNK